MIAKRFQSFQRLAICTVAVMGLYIITSQVAAERTELERVDRKIMTARKDIRQLQTELGTRANLRQLEAWNGEVLALSTPDADQFVADERMLATLDRSGVTPGPRYAPSAVVMAMAQGPAETATDAVVLPDQTAKRALSAEAKKPEKVLPPAKPKAAKPEVKLAAAEIRRPTTEPRPRAKAQKPIDLLETKLLDDGLVGELASRARAEGGGRRTQ